jgi:hypothetical protein
MEHDEGLPETSGVGPAGKSGRIHASTSPQIEQTRTVKVAPSPTSVES